MDSVSRYLVSPIVDRGANNDKASGGLPHSEITGSKPIPGSPVLIAGYHVLHRLLLPRHPPNALLALDPIQRRTGQNRRPFVQRPNPSSTPSRRSPGRKSYSFPPRDRVRPRDIWLVYLTWNKTAFGPPHGAQVTPTLGRTSGSDVSLSSRLSNASGSDETAPLRRWLIPSQEQIGGAYRDRTDDPLLAKQMLSQLS